jgi:hypothetical protein
MAVRASLIPSLLLVRRDSRAREGAGVVCCVEERRVREQWWEAEAETTVIREGKAGYEDKIKKLEEEGRRLREEVRIFCLIFFPFTFIVLTFFLFPKAGEVTNNDSRRLLVFPFHTSTSTSTNTCFPSNTNSSGSSGGVPFRCSRTPVTHWHASRGSN